MFVLKKDIRRWEIPDISEYCERKKEVDEDPLAPQWPFRMLCAAPSGSGKSTAVFKLLFNLKYDDLYVFCGDPTEEQYEMLDKCCDLLEEEMPDKRHVITDDLSLIPDPNELDKTRRSIFIFDDLVNVKNAAVIKKINDMFIRGRKRNASSIYISQSYKNTPGIVRQNCTYYCLWKMPQRNEVTELGKIFRDVLDMKEFYKLYAFCTNEPYSFMFIDKSMNPKSGIFRKRFNQVILLN